MEKPKIYSRVGWANEQKGKLEAVEQKYRDQMDLADAQGLIVDREKIMGEKRSEIKSILTAAQYRHYLENGKG